MFAVIATRPNSVHQFSNSYELVTFLACVDSFDTVDVVPHFHHFHVEIQHAPSLVKVRTEEHAYALAEIFRKAGYHDVSIDGVADEEESTPLFAGLIDIVIDSILNAGKGGKR